MKAIKNRKSNVDFTVFNLGKVRRVYGLESNNKKHISISKEYIQSDSLKNGYGWNGRYDIEYDGVTDLSCYIDLNNDNELEIEFVSGESIHGTSEFYELDADLEWDKNTIDTIVNIVKNDEPFKNFCIAKHFIKEYVENNHNNDSDLLKGYLKNQKKFGKITLECLIPIPELQHMKLPFVYDNDLILRLADDNFEPRFNNFEFLTDPDYHKKNLLLKEITGESYPLVLNNQENYEVISEYYNTNIKGLDNNSFDINEINKSINNDEIEM